MATIDPLNTAAKDGNKLKSKQTVKHADVTQKTMEIEFDFGLDFADLVDGMFDVDDYVPVVSPVHVDSAVPVLFMDSAVPVATCYHFFWTKRFILHSWSKALSTKYKDSSAIVYFKNLVKLSMNKKT